MPKIKFYINRDLKGVIPDIKPASKIVPKWYKDMPLMDAVKETVNERNATVFVDHPLMKRCLPVRDYLTSGYIIPYWSNTVLTKTSEGTYLDVSHTPKNLNEDYNIGVDWHSRGQVKNSPLEQLTDGEKLLKLMCPWTLKTPKGYSTLFFSPFYHENQVTILPAIVDTDTFNIPTNFPAIIMDDNVKINMGDPIIQAVPFKRESWTSDIVSSKKGDLSKNRSLYALLTSNVAEYTRNLWHRKYFR